MKNAHEYFHKMFFTQEIETKLNERENENIKTPPIVEATSSNQNEGIMGTSVANLVVIIGFAAFAYTVKCVICGVGNS